MSEKESAAILENIRRQPGVLGTILMASNGIMIKSTFGDAETAEYTTLISDFIQRTRVCTNDLLPGQNLQVLRVRSFKNEIIIIPDKVFTLAIVQDSGIA